MNPVSQAVDILIKDREMDVMLWLGPFPHLGLRRKHFPVKKEPLGTRIQHVCLSKISTTMTNSDISVRDIHGGLFSITMHGWEFH